MITFAQAKKRQIDKYRKAMEAETGDECEDALYETGCGWCEYANAGEAGPFSCDRCPVFIADGKRCDDLGNDNSILLQRSNALHDTTENRRAWMMARLMWTLEVQEP